MAATDIIDSAEAKLALNFTATDLSNNGSELAQVISAASALVDSVYGPVVQRTITNERHAGGGSSLWLNYRPVVSITSVNEYAGGTATLLTAETEAVAGTYRVDLTTGQVWRRTSWTDSYFGSQSVLVTYVAGRYANTTAVEPKFKEAAVVALAHLWQHRGANSGAATFGGDGAPFAGVPFSSEQLRKKLVSLYPEEWVGPAVA